MKLFFALFVLYLFTATSSARSENFDGFYAGVEGSYEQLHTRYKGRVPQFIDPLNSANNTYEYFSGNDNQYDIGGDIFGGYGYRFENNIYLGGEIGGDLKHSDTYSASLRLGYIPEENALIYVRGGYARTKIHDDDANFSNDRNHLNGISGGAGIEIAFTDHITSRVEFLYTQYENFTNSDVSGDTEAKIRPSDAAGKIGIVYNF